MLSLFFFPLCFLEFSMKCVIDQSRQTWFNHDGVMGSIPSVLCFQQYAPDYKELMLKFVFQSTSISYSFPVVFEHQWHGQTASYVFKSFTWTVQCYIIYLNYSTVTIKMWKFSFLFQVTNFTISGLKFNSADIVHWHLLRWVKIFLDKLNF